jgi:hypothetical protein
VDNRESPRELPGSTTAVAGVGFAGREGDGAKQECYVHNLWTDLWNIGKARARGASGE